MIDSNLSPGPTIAPAPLRLLIVDANSSHLLVLGRRLAEQGYRIVAAQSAAAAIAELTRGQVELVLADVHLPQMGGIELVRVIRGEALWQDLPVVLLAGRSNAGAVVEGFAAGADDVVIKPFDFDVLYARIARQLARARMLGELRQDNAMLDARVVRRAIELSEARNRLVASEAERTRLEALVAARAPETAR